MAKDASAAEAKGSCCAKPQPAENPQTHVLNEVQTALGNQALGLMIQAEFEVSHPDDSSEKDADRVADEVMSGSRPSISSLQRRRPTTPLQRKCDDCKEEDEQQGTPQTLSRKPADLAGRSQQSGSAVRLASQINATKSGGTRIDRATRSFMEDRFGADFSHVRIHTGDQAAEMSRELHAHAFTLGDHIYFGSGRFAPETTAGKRLLAHELAHTIQQSGEFRPKRIQRDWAIEPPSPADATRVLTAEEVAAAIRYNRSKLGANNALIMELRDVLGISHNAPDIDQEFVEAVQRWQAAYNLPQDGMLGPDTVAPLLRELRGEGLNAEATLLANLVRRGRVRSGPTYTPNGAVAPTPGGAGNQADFRMAAEFEHDPPNGIFASCCEVRQEISWDAAMAAAFTASTGNPIPHNGFPATHPADTRIEDRGPGDGVRFGHRTGPWGGVGVPAPFENRFVNAAGVTDNANGARFIGRDLPSMLSTWHGVMRFRLSVVDVCNGGVRISGFDNITITW